LLVAENRKLATSQLTNLNHEEGKLRARLQKVEAGTKGWEALLEALKHSQAATSIAEPPPAAARVEPSAAPARKG
jgi:hypothetical protein